MLAGILVRGFVSVSVLASGFAYDPDQDGDGDDRDDYQDEQGNYGYGQGISSPRGCRGRRVYPPDGLNTTPYRRVPRVIGYWVWDPLSPPLSTSLAKLPRSSVRLRSGLERMFATVSPTAPPGGSA